MSDSNAGARKGRNVKDHLFVTYGVINAVVKGDDDSIDLQIYDIEKAFDSLWLEDSLNDIIDNISDDKQNDKIALLYKMNESNMEAVNTPFGPTEKINMS